MANKVKRYSYLVVRVDHFRDSNVTFAIYGVYTGVRAARKAFLIAKSRTIESEEEFRVQSLPMPNLERISLFVAKCPLNEGFTLLDVSMFDPANYDGSESITIVDEFFLKG